MGILDALMTPPEPLPTITPDSIKRRRLLNELQIKQGIDYSPIQSPWQGAARVVNAMLGAYDDRRVDEIESKAKSDAGAALLAAFGGQATAPGQPTAGAALTHQPAPAAVNPGTGKIYANNEPSPLDPPSGADRQAMIATILGEAGNQGAVGQNAVASVIRNRAVNGGYGGTTPASVVTAPNQFEPWNTDVGRSKMLAAMANPALVKSADAAIASAYGEGGGAPNDPTGGATMFFSPKVQAALGRPVPAWGQGQGQDIGDHRFFGAPTQPASQPAPQAAVPDGGSGISPTLIKALSDPFVDPTMKQIAMLQLQNQMKSETTDEIKEYNLAKRQGFKGDFFEYKTGIKKAGAQNISIDQKPELSFDQKAGQLQADRFNDIVADGQTARQMVSDLQTLTELGKKIGTGKGAEFRASVGPYAEQLGIKMDGLSDIQAFEAIVNRMAPNLRVKGSGAQSDFELRNFLKSLPTLGNTPEGNAISAEVMKGMQENKIRAAEIGSRALTKEISRQDAEKMLRELPDPMENYRKFMKARGDESSKTSDGWKDLGNGVRIREKR